jgi:glyoxylase-like metal-dependent hydrolase (beta-lactamase superfamily II)
MIREEQIGPLKILFGRHPSYPYCNTLLVKDQRTMLVDPACEEKTLRLLASEEKVDFLFNTHYHPDHIRYNPLFGGAELLVHRADAPCFRSLDAMAEWVGVKGTNYEEAWKSSVKIAFTFLANHLKSNPWYFPGLDLCGRDQRVNSCPKGEDERPRGR